MAPGTSHFQGEAAGLVDDKSVTENLHCDGARLRRQGRSYCFPGPRAECRLTGAHGLAYNSLQCGAVRGLLWT